MAAQPRIHVPARWAKAAGHPELAGRTLQEVRGPRGGLLGYRGIRGDLKGQTFSAGVVRRIERIGEGLPLTLRDRLTRHAHTIQKDARERHLPAPSFRQAYAQARHRWLHGEGKIKGYEQSVADYRMRHPDASKATAQKEVRNALLVLDNPKHLQTAEERTQALRTIGAIGPDDYYVGEPGHLVLVRASRAAA